jgi:hypothetical protein
MRAASKVAPFFLLIFLSVVLAASTVLAAGDTAMRLKIGEKAPDFRLKDVMTGKTVTLSEFAGKKSRHDRILGYLVRHLQTGDAQPRETDQRLEAEGIRTSLHRPPRG